MAFSDTGGGNITLVAVYCYLGLLFGGNIFGHENCLGMRLMNYKQHAF